MLVKKIGQGFYHLSKGELKVEVIKDINEPQYDWKMNLKDGEYVETFTTLREAKEWFKNWELENEEVV